MAPLRCYLPLPVAIQGHQQPRIRGLNFDEIFTQARIGIQKNVMNIGSAGVLYVSTLSPHPPFLDTHVSLAPTHVCLSVRWSVRPLVRPLVTLSDFQSVSVSGRPT